MNSPVHGGGIRIKLLRGNAKNGGNSRTGVEETTKIPPGRADNLIDKSFHKIIADPPKLFVFPGELFFYLTPFRNLPMQIPVDPLKLPGAFRHEILQMGLMLLQNILHALPLLDLLFS
jgi:hypothetical protein